VIACIVPALLSAQTAPTRSLTVGKPVAGTLAPGSSNNYSLAVHAGDIVTFKIDTGPAVITSLFDPSGKLERVFLLAESPKLPLRLYLDAGSMELDMTGHGGSILEPNRHLRDVLRAKGYDVFYHEFIGAHDYASWRETLADGLILLIGTPASAS
jgi:hypothetical protein